MKLSPEQKEKRRIVKEESKRLERQKQEEALRLEMEEFFREFPWKILELLKTAEDLNITYSLKEITNTGETIISFKFPSTETISFHPHEIKTQSSVIYNNLVWELENLELLFNSVREKRDEEERRQKLKRYALSKLSKDEIAALGL